MQPSARIDPLATPWEYTQARHEPHHDYVVPAILKRIAHVPAGARILDMGCGSGYLCGQLLQSGYRVTGVDPSQSGIETARRTFPNGRFEVASATDPALPMILNERFEAVVSMETIEHVYSAALFLKNSREMLESKGVLVISTPYHGYLKLLLLGISGRMESHLQPNLEGGHIKFWSRATLGRAFREHGFEITGFDGCGRLPWLWKSMVMSGVKCDR
jgi:2-polyprenyl-3-methyl-5-hydroxy-6-metoxy-1,4-benzoquinol methylase